MIKAGQLTDICRSRRLAVPLPQKLLARSAQPSVEAHVINVRNTDVGAVKVKAVEGLPLYGGEMTVKPLIKGDEMTFLEIHYAAGVGAPLHSHTHESIAYVVRGKVKSTVGSDEFIMGPGDVCRHPKGVLHGLEAIEESLVVEIKSPAPEIVAFFR
jgi:quercetin dioxygenase-like cupin family protein